MNPARLLAAVFAVLFLAVLPRARGDAMLQYFNTDYRELMAKVPELAEVGYTSLWLPPPCKGSGGLSVGYDLWDRFDLGSKNQRGTVRTRYGSEAELLELIELCHRFGIRVYFDNIMNHNAFDIPGFNATTPITTYPGFLPEDFHLRITEDGFYRKWDNTRDWNDSWQVQNLGLSDLIDIAHETPNTNHGKNEGDDIPKITYVRQPFNPEYYLDTDLPQVVNNGAANITVYPFANKEPFQDVGYNDGGNTIGAGNGTFDFKDLDADGQHDVGEPSEPFTDTGVDPTNPTRQTAAWGFGNNRYDMGNPVAEDVGGILIRSIRWQVDRTKADGFRLDAVKHVPDYFFGQQGGSGKDRSNAGYLGGAQEQFNLARGFSDWDNHRDSLFNVNQGRDDLMMFGEHLGQPPGYSGYWDAGMRLVDNDLRNNFNNVLGNPSASLAGFDEPGSGGFAPNLGVMHAQSHDNDYAARRELQHAFYFTRAGIPLVYTDGNHHAGILGASGGAFPRHSNTAFLGQFGDKRLPNLVYLHNHFARGGQVARWSDADFVAYDRIDKSENGSMPDSDGVTALMMVNDNYANGQRPFDRNGFKTAFPPGAYLYQYADGQASNGDAMTGFYVTTLDAGNGTSYLPDTVTVPRGGYFLFSWRSPEESDLWRDAGGKPLTILQNGQPLPTINVERKDGPDGDAAFNPLGLPDTNTTDYAYTIPIPLVTDAANLSFIARTDASAENILFSLDGGVDINSHIPLGPTTGDKRDNAPALSTDIFLGYEQAQFSARQYGEKFAAADTLRNKFASAGADTFITTVGSGTVNVVPSTATNSFSTDSGNHASFIYHDPTVNVVAPVSPNTAGKMYRDTGADLEIWAKPNSVGAGFRMVLYYTTDGTNPEGAGGTGIGTTKTQAMNFQHIESGANPGDWWKGVVSPKPTGQLRYKIGIYRDRSGTNPVASVFPSGSTEVTRKKRGMTTFQINGFNGTTATIRPHNDYSTQQTGLSEGFHVLRARAFLNRGGKASIYNTWTQTFYYDAAPPGGEIKFPANDNETIGGNNYGLVVRTDSSVREVWYRFEDGDATNDDITTETQAGNGAGPEPFTDTDGDGVRDTGEAFTDINGNGTFDANLPATWARASEVTPSAGIASVYPREWRFNYRNIPSTGTATIRVRLLETSSIRNMTLTPAQARATELTRFVITNGPDIRMFVAYPQQDGQTVNEGYVMKVRFSAALADGTTEAQLRARFSVRIASDESGSTTGGILQPAQTLPILYNVAAGFHDFQFALPNMYNDVPDFLHTIEVTQTRPGNTDLVTTRRVKAAVTTPAVFVNIVNPAEFDSDGKPVEIVLPKVAAPTAAQRQFTIEVETGTDALATSIAFANNTGTATLISDGTPNPRTEGNRLLWRFLWSSITEGKHTFTANVNTDADAAFEGSATRNTTVIFREIEPRDELDDDDDDDGLGDLGEATVTALPTTAADDWTNGQVHIYYAYGVTNPLWPDSDGDGLPDGLEVGWRVSTNPPTDPLKDTNADGFKNFIGDLDPPFFNTTDNIGTVPGVNTIAEGGDRSKQVAGTMTNPNSDDTDRDGLKDGLEDTNRNGWVDGDGASLATAAAPTLARNWPNNKIDSSESWTETSPTKADSDEDGLSDGNGEDKDASGTITGDTNNNRIYNPGETWTETNPLRADTDGDGLSDGWESRFGLDPLDNGTDSFRTATADDGLPRNGGSGDPDGDTFTNLQELANGTDPLTPDTGVPPSGTSIVIGPQTPVTVSTVTNLREFTDWKLNHLIVLDEPDGEGTNNGGGDIYHSSDGYDSSRDLVAFYAHDGGDVALGGDGKFYFRVDFRDLKPLAEDGYLNTYVVIDTGNAAAGEYALPDDVDTGTEMRWEAVVACYSGNNGRVYVDTNLSSNSTAIGQNLTTYGVVPRDQNTANGFLKSYYNSELDALEFSISRQALRDAGWNGLNPAQLRYQVFTTKDGTTNSPVGAGDIGGRSDIRDTIYDDYLASDYYADQAGISGSKSVLKSWFGVNSSNDRGRRAKVISIVHGNQTIQPGSVTHGLINTTQSAGYYRALNPHEAYNVPLTMHITPTLASAIQWAAVDPLSPRQYRSGPVLNARVKSLVERGTIELLGSTFADHPIDYFTDNFNLANKNLATTWLTSFYAAPTPRVFWNPERIAASGTFAKISALGATHTFVDQMRHLFKWFGRESALSNDGYRINRINGVDCFVINDTANSYRFTNTDSGLDTRFRDLLLRKARSGQQDQVVVLMGNWEDYTNGTSAAAYDRNIRWLASRPWVELTTPDAIATGKVDLSVPPDGLGDTWGKISRGSGLTLARTQHDYLDFSTQENYDNWMNGQSGREESLRDKRFDIRPGVQLPVASIFGSQTAATGVVTQAWNAVSGLSRLGTLAKGATGAALFQAGFHNQPATDLRKYSTGAYIYPDASNNTLAAFAKAAQSQFRHAAAFQRVEQWGSVAASGAYNASVTTDSADVDLDGEAEYMIYNDRIFALFERIGGRLVGAWVRDVQTSAIYQAIGNPLAYSGSETEAEGDTNLDGTVLDAHRTSAFKDWFAQTTGPGVGSSTYVNDLYTASPAPSGIGWRFTSADGKIQKTITLAADSTRLLSTYNLTGGVSKVFVRFGMSPHLEDLLLNGQKNLRFTHNTSLGEVNVHNVNPLAPVRTFVKYAGAGFSGAYSAAATDDAAPTVDYDTVPMRNQAQTHQVEMELTTGQTIALGLQTGATDNLDSDGDGIPDWWELCFDLNPESSTGRDGADGDPDQDGYTNLQEFIAGSNPITGEIFSARTEKLANGMVAVKFLGLRDRNYRIYYRNDLSQPWTLAADVSGIGAEQTWTDDGTLTGTHPATRPTRFYRVQARLTGTP